MHTVQLPAIVFCAFTKHVRHNFSLSPCFGRFYSLIFRKTSFIFLFSPISLTRCCCCCYSLFVPVDRTAEHYRVSSCCCRLYCPFSSKLRTSCIHFSYHIEDMLTSSMDVIVYFNTNINRFSGVTERYYYSNIQRLLSCSFSIRQ